MATVPADPYRTLIADLPRPTGEQTERFVRFVAGAHSWYKHLPSFPPGAAFTFFLDPNSGRDRIRTPSGETAFADRDDPSRAFHYTWRLTADYRDAFGYWNYDSDAGPSFLVSAPGGAWRDLSTQPVVLDPEGRWLPVPEDLARPGTCLVTGLVHERFPPTLPFGDPRRFHHAFEGPARERPDDPEVRRYLPLLVLAREYERHEAAAREADDEPAVEAWRARYEDLCTRVETFHEVERQVQRDRIRQAMRAFLEALDRA